MCWAGLEAGGKQRVAFQPAHLTASLVFHTAALQFLSAREPPGRCPPTYLCDLR